MDGPLTRAGTKLVSTLALKYILGQSATTSLAIPYQGTATARGIDPTDISHLSSVELQKLKQLKDWAAVTDLNLFNCHSRDSQICETQGFLPS